MFPITIIIIIASLSLQSGWCNKRPPPSRLDDMMQSERQWRLCSSRSYLFTLCSSSAFCSGLFGILCSKLESDEFNLKHSIAYICSERRCPSHSFTHEGISVIRPRIQETITSNHRRLPSNHRRYCHWTRRIPIDFSPSTQNNHATPQPLAALNQWRKQSRIRSPRDPRLVWCVGPLRPGVSLHGLRAPFIVCRSLSFSDCPVSPLWVFSLCLWALSYAYRPFCLCLQALSFMPMGLSFATVLCAVLTVSLMICYPLLSCNTACHLVAIQIPFNQICT